MVKLQNNFLKLYEEMNHLWESSDNSTPESDNISASNETYDFSFSTIVQKALAAQKQPDRLDIKYWCTLREILFNKHVRLGDIAASTWYGRFLSFYKTYRVECALKDWLNANVKQLRGVEFEDGDDHHSIWTEVHEAKPDFKTEAKYTIECKEYKSDSSIHGADLVIRHAPAGQKVIYFCLVGEWETLQALFNAVTREDLPGYVYCLDHTRKLNDGFPRFPIVRDIPKIEMTDYKELDTIENALEFVDSCLENNLEAAEQKAAWILDNHTQQISNVIKKSAPEGAIKQPSLPSKDLDAAVVTLTDTAKDLQNVVTSLSENN